MKLHVKPLLFLLLPLWLMKPAIGYSQQTNIEIPLYEKGKIPNEVPGPDEEKSYYRPGNILVVEKVRKPTLSIFLPPSNKANGTAVIICPGGGYSVLAIDHEGYAVAKKLNEQGIAAFVLKSRLPDPKTASEPSIAPLQDAQQALLLVRQNAKKWHVNPAKVGILGFSAGGHLASTAATHFQKSYIANPNKVNLRPDFVLLIYPVISSNKQISHQGSFVNLLGKNATAEELKEFSNELQVTPQTPPAFLVHASDDDLVNPENSILFYQALLRNKVPAELHLYQNGGHGFGLNNKTTRDAWFERAVNWLHSNNLIPDPQL